MQGSQLGLECFFGFIGVALCQGCLLLGPLHGIVRNFFKALPLSWLRVGRGTGDFTGLSICWGCGQKPGGRINTTAQEVWGVFCCFFSGLFGGVAEFLCFIGTLLRLLGGLCRGMLFLCLVEPLLGSFQAVFGAGELFGPGLICR